MSKKNAPAEVVWWRNAWIVVRVLYIASGIVALSLGIYQQLHPEANLSFIIALPVALFTASFSASMGMWLYSQITRDSRDAQFRFEQVYKPMYDDLMQVIGSLDSCQVARFEKWREISETSLKEFVAPEVTKAMNGLEPEFEKYSRIWQDSYAAAERELALVVTGWVGVTDTATRIADLLKQHRRFLFDPETRSVHENTVSILVGYLSQASNPVPIETAADIIKSTKSALMKDEKVIQRVTAVKALMLKVEAARLLVLKRLMSPLT